MKTTTIESTLLQGREALLGYIRKKVGDADLAEDILQESLLKALRSSHDLREEEKLTGWFYRIVDNAIIDLFRRRKVELKYLAEAVDEIETAVQPEEKNAICACFRRIIPTMKPEYAELIERIDLAEGDPESVAADLGITRNNLKVRLHRARTQLRERLEQTCRTCARHGCLDCTCARH
jgi:RNA polymerase sigma-70 factor (ECF subfamily)